MYQVMIHPPEKQEEIEKIMREIAQFRADKTLRILQAQGVTVEQLQALLAELQTPQCIETGESVILHDCIE